MRIRREVFVDEHGLFSNSDLDEREPGAIHLIAYVDGQPAGTVRVHYGGGGHWTGSRLAVLPALRSRGAGSALIIAAEAVVLARGCSRFTALVRKDCAELFSRHGWIDEGEGPEVSGERHRSMRSSLASKMTLFTTGYQGHTPDTFVDMLEFSGVRRLIDVRERAFSRKKGFSKTALAQALAEKGIKYEHVPEVGSPARVRKEYISSGDLAEFTARYLEHLSRQPKALEDLASMVQAAPSCLMCLEADPSGCHRSLLARELSRRIDDPVVVNI